jgi:hypothetical protein
MLEEASQQRFQLPPQAILTAAQAQDLMNLLFARRAERLKEMPLADSEIHPQPIISGYVPPVLRPLATRPAVTAFAALVLFIFLLWLFL